LERKPEPKIWLERGCKPTIKTTSISAVSTDSIFYRTEIIQVRGYIGEIHASFTHKLVKYRSFNKKLGSSGRTIVKANCS
jgi:hypothetical protein